MRVAIEQSGEQVESGGDSLEDSVGSGALFAGVFKELLCVDGLELIHDS